MLTHLTFDHRIGDGETVAEDENAVNLPIVLFPQLLGLCMGVDPDVLGVEMDRPGITNLTDFLKTTKVAKADRSRRDEAKSRKRSKSRG